MKNTKLVNDYKEFVNKSAGKLRAFRAAAWPILILAALSCTKDSISTVCLDGDCNATIVFPVKADENGYYHIPLDWNREYYPYFGIDIEADVVSPEYRYAGESVVTARFDSDTTWVIGDTLVVQQAYYQPFSEEWTSTAGALPSSIRNLNLTQFAGTVINIAQPTHIYFREINGIMHSKRILGPFPPHMIGDTIQVYMEIMWDAGDKSIINVTSLQKFIVE